MGLAWFQIELYDEVLIYLKKQKVCFGSGIIVLIIPDTLGPVYSTNLAELMMQWANGKKRIDYIGLWSACMREFKFVMLTPTRTAGSRAMLHKGGGVFRQFTWQAKVKTKVEWCSFRNPFGATVAVVAKAYGFQQWQRPVVFRLGTKLHSDQRLAMVRLGLLGIVLAIGRGHHIVFLLFAFHNWTTYRGPSFANDEENDGDKKLEPLLFSTPCNPTST
ncbi:hypothetical protein Tco_0678064 [Tanacetum coccineum]|uniref:Uncharacterized protein n=1 Tax=Tanacetum coccineum TaxID=301880 RepID=A0ABQ4XEN2_9ASTR